jgi:hypothetical protein
MSDSAAITLIPVYQMGFPFEIFELNTNSPLPRQSSLGEHFGKPEPAMVAAADGGRSSFQFACIQLIIHHGAAFERT